MIRLWMVFSIFVYFPIFLVQSIGGGGAYKNLHWVPRGFESLPTWVVCTNSESAWVTGTTLMIHRSVLILKTQMLDEQRLVE